MAYGQVRTVIPEHYMGQPVNYLRLADTYSAQLAILAAASVIAADGLLFFIFFRLAVNA